MDCIGQLDMICLWEREIQIMDWTAIGVGVSVVVMLGSLMLYLHSSLMDEIKALKSDLQFIDRRLSRMEGENDISKTVMLGLISKDKT